jgi:hypothetical protein
MNKDLSFFVCILFISTSAFASGNYCAISHNPNDTIEPDSFFVNVIAPRVFHIKLSPLSPGKYRFTSDTSLIFDKRSIVQVSKKHKFSYVNSFYKGRKLMCRIFYLNDGGYFKDFIMTIQYYRNGKLRDTVHYNPIP